MGFRYFAIRAAHEAGISGTVRNLGDGSVEAIAEGSAPAIDQFREALKRGPSYSHVIEVVEIEMAFTGTYPGFDVVF